MDTSRSLWCFTFLQTASGFLSSLLSPQAFSPFYGHHRNGVSSGEPRQDQTWLGRSPLYRFSTGRQSGVGGGGGGGERGGRRKGKRRRGEEGAVPMGRSRGIGVGTSVHFIAFLQVDRVGVGEEVEGGGRERGGGGRRGQSLWAGGG